MTENQKLLADYVKSGSQGAFRELVARYTNFVYSTAMRLTGGDSHLAEDVSQTVFVDLARKAGNLSPDVMLGDWLHRHTCFVAATAMRGVRRRQSREREAALMNALQNHADENLAQIAPVLDEAINQLGAEERTAILLRYFEQHDLRSVGEVIGTSENAARMRVSRALEKLRTLLGHRGVTLSAAGLGAVLAAEAVTAAPAGLALSFSNAALAATTAGGGTTLGILKFMSMTKLKAGVIGVLLIAGAAAPWLVEYETRVQMREENQALRQQIAQLQADTDLANSAAQGKKQAALRLPAPRIAAHAAPRETPPEDIQSTNLYARLKDKSPKLTVEQLEGYLKGNRRSAASLLAAFRTSGDTNLLQEAMRDHPEDPQVDFEAAIRSDAKPEERRQWLDALKKSAPDNALVNYLSAEDYIKSGNTDQAVQELMAASGKPGFQDYTLDRVQDDEEAYLAAGYSVADAKVVSSSQLLLPQLSQVKQLGRDMAALADSYQQAGDVASAQATLQMTLDMGQRYGNETAGEPLISELMGIAVERIALDKMDAAAPYGSDGQTVQNALDQLTQQRTTLANLSNQSEPLLPAMSDEDWVSYKDRWRLFGGPAAMQWVINKYGQH